MRYDPSLLHRLCYENFDFFVQQVVKYLNPGTEFTDAPYIGAMCETLMHVGSGDLRKVVVTIPPRHLKSTIVSVAFVAWMLGRDPTLRFVVASYGEELSTKHGRDFRSILEWEFFKAVFPACRINPRRNTAAEIQTTRGGGRRAVSLGGPLTGLGADIIIIDDLLKAQDGALSATERQRARDYYEHTLYSRLDNKATGKILVVQQRLHEDDFVAYVLPKDGFVHLNFPAITRKDETFQLPRGRQFTRRIGDLLCPERESRESLESTRRQVGNAVFEAQWQQDPTTAGANLLRVEQFQRYEGELERRHLIYVFQSWDTALGEGPTNDYSVCLTAGYHLREKAWLIVDVQRVRKEFAELQGFARTLAAEWRADRIFVEESGTGRALALYLCQHFGRVAFSIPVRDSKEERLAAGSPLVVDGTVRVPRQADWLELFFAEIRSFPNGRNDDQVDALSQFLNFLLLPRTDKFVRRAIARKLGLPRRRR